MPALNQGLSATSTRARRRGSYRGVFFALAFLAGPLVATAGYETGRPIAAEPIATGNRNPFVAIQGLPPARGAGLAATGTTRLTLHADAANTSIVEDRDGARRTVIDGETHRLELDLRHAPGDGWEIGLTLPLLRHGGGFLDRPIEEWHDLFRLPNGNRDRLPSDRLLFSQRVSEGSGFRLDNAGGGFGDLQLAASRRLGESLALRGVLKLPTGDSERLTGSGAAALAASLHTDGRLGDTLRWHASGGLLVNGDGDVLPEHRENLLAFGSATLAWQVTDNLALKTQLDAHTAAYRNTGRPLDRGSLQLSVGAAFALSPQWAVEFGFSEDIAVETAPDIVFHAGLRHRF